MSDLQCPAYLALATPAQLPALAALLGERPLICLYLEAAAAAPGVEAAAARFAEATGCGVALRAQAEPPRQLVEGLADLHRGELVALIAAPATVAAALLRAEAPDTPTLLAIDADGWARVDPLTSRW